MENKNSFVTYVMVVALVVGAYFLGTYKTKYELVTKGNVENEPSVEVKGTADAPAAEQPERKTVLTNEEWQKAVEGPAATLGSEAAKVTVVEFTDYQCPFCARYDEQTFLQVKSEYIDTGKIRYLVHDLPLSFHKHAKTAAVAVRCAAGQGKYWEMRQKVFGGQEAWGEAEDAESVFGGYAGEIGLNRGLFEGCMDDANILAAVDADSKLAASSGASGTPTFIINGKLLVGAQPFEAFKTAIDSALE